MRLNRNSVIFIALLVVVIVVALIFLRDDDSGGEDTVTEVAMAESVQLFPGVAERNINSLIIIEQLAADTAESTPETDDSDPAPTTATVVLNRDSESGEWSVGDETTQTVDGTINTEQLNSVIAALVTLRANRQFIPVDGNYSQFGLDDPAYDITLVEESDTTTPYRLRVGNRTVGESAYYALLDNDDETIYVVTNAGTFQSNVLNLTQQVPLEPTAVPTAVPVLNTTAPFADFVLTAGNGFVFRDNENDSTITVERNPDGAGWVYADNGDELPVQQESLQVILNNFSTISGFDQVDDANLEALGLDDPAYRFEASTVDGLIYVLQLGNQDPTGSFYYGLVNDFDDVVLIDSDSVLSFIDLFDNQPPLLEPEATEDSQ